jgi:outer membrane protein assembly factor BamB
MVGCDLASTGFSPSDAPGSNATSWIANLPAAGSGWWPYPVVSEGKVFISLGDNLTAWDETDGDLLWNYHAPSGLGLPCNIAVADGRVFSVAHEGNGVYASNATTGQHLWALTGATYEGGGPLIEGDRLYLGGGLDSTGVVYCLNATTGALIWSYSPVQDRVNSIAVAYGKVYVGCGHWETATEGAIYCLDKYDGSFVWSFDTDRDYTGGLAVANGKVYFSASYEGWNCIVYALNATSGAVVWSTTRYPSGSAGCTAVAYGKAFVCLGYSGRGVYALSEINGDEIWAFPIVPEQPVPGHQSNPLWAVAADGKVFFGPSYPDHMFYAVSENTGFISWSYRLTGGIEGKSGAIANGRVFVADHWDLKLYAFGTPTISPLSVSISPLSASIPIGQSASFTSTASGGAPPYSYQWYVDGAPVSDATSALWTFAPTGSGVYYVYLKVTDAEASTSQSDTARITVASVPVGGYSFPVQVHTKAEPIAPYVALVAALTLTLNLRRKIKRKRA